MEEIKKTPPTITTLPREVAVRLAINIGFWVRDFTQKSLVNYDQTGDCYVEPPSKYMVSDFASGIAEAFNTVSPELGFSHTQENLKNSKQE